MGSTLKRAEKRVRYKIVWSCDSTDVVSYQGRNSFTVLSGIKGGLYMATTGSRRALELSRCASKLSTNENQQGELSELGYG